MSELIIFDAYHIYSCVIVGEIEKGLRLHGFVNNRPTLFNEKQLLVISPKIIN